MELLDRVDPSVEELTTAVEQKVKKRSEALRLMTHPGVGPITALAYVLIIGTPERFARGKQIAVHRYFEPFRDLLAFLPFPGSAGYRSDLFQSVFLSGTRKVSPVA